MENCMGESPSHQDMQTQDPGQALLPPETSRMCLPELWGGSPSTGSPCQLGFLCGEPEQFLCCWIITLVTPCL